MSKIHLIGNAHLDPVWLWRWQEGYAEVLATFRSALDRINEYDDFVFTCSSAAYYEWVEETDPEMFEEIKQAVKNGKWVIVGGWYVQPDCNLPAGESYARHALYSQRYYKEKFGITCSVGYNVDSFGHSAMLPQLLKNGGMDYYVFMRPSDAEKKYPFEGHTFLWTSPDGTTIPAYKIPEPYLSLPFGESAQRALEHRDMLEGENGQPLMCFYGVGNHGGGPTIQNIEALLDLMENEPQGDFAFSSPNTFFKEINTDTLPHYNGELQHHASGCYSAVMKVKSLNRIGEQLLQNAEKWDVAARLLGVTPSHKSLKDAWKVLLFNQFHDAMCGCCIKSATEDTIRSFSESISVAERVQNRALQAIAWNVDTTFGKTVRVSKTERRYYDQDDIGAPYLVFNPAAHPVTTPVKFGNFVTEDLNILGFVTDSDGNEVPMQTVRSEVTDAETDKYETEIIAELPAYGWKLYFLHRNGNAQPFDTDLTVFENRIENGLIRVDIKDGYISGIFDKSQNRELLTAPCVPLIIDDSMNDTWAHGNYIFDKQLGSFSPDGVIIKENGGLLCTLRLKYVYNHSEMYIDVTLYKNTPQVRLDCSVNWREKHKLLKISFPTVYKNGVETAAVPYGFFERTADGEEYPMGKWLCLEEGSGGFAVMTDTRSSYSAKDGEIRITALRSPIYADHVGTRDEFCEFTEQGISEFTLTVSPTADFSEIYRISENLLMPPSTLATTYHKGKLGGKGSLMEISADNIAVTALKPSEDGDGYILRCHEICGKPTRADFKLLLPKAEFSADFGAQEIKTFKITDNSVVECDFLEEEK